MNVGVGGMKVATMVLALAVLAAYQIYAIPPRRTDEGYKRAIVDGADTRFLLRVLDDDGRAVEDALVRVDFAMREKVLNATFKTGADGATAVQGKTTGNKICITVEKPGHYRSKLEFSYLRFAENRVASNGRWQPWNEERTIRLRKIGGIESLPSYSKTMFVPVTNEWIGLDLELGDWIRPHGQGLSPDVEVRVLWDGKEPYYCKTCKTEMRFSQVMSGAYSVANVGESEMPFPFDADTNAVYRSSFEYYDRKGGRLCRTTLLPVETKVARVRCRVSDDGKLIAANYCNIRRLEASPGNQGTAVLGLAGVFNPTPNNTKLEPLRK